MAQFFPLPQQQQQHNPYAPNQQSFYPNQYGADPRTVSGHTTPAQNSYGFGSAAGAMGSAMGAMNAMGAMGAMGGGMGGATMGGPRGQLSTGWLAAFGTSGYDDEPPLLEELGVNFGHIKSKTLAVLNPLSSVDQHIMDDADLGGPIIFVLLFGTFLLLSGKIHFGYIYGVALLGTISLHFLFNLMSTPGHSLSYIRSASVLGYCLLPLVITSLVGVVLRANMNGMIGYLISILAIAWCTNSASNMFVTVLRVQDMRFLLAYPLALFYSVFGIMAIFGSGGVPTGNGGSPLGGAGNAVPVKMNNF
ncbi:Yip1-domain-containing protein [Ascobolus immersus RN42]|uniref:Protein YIP n=1 Tax=Ascobolus immersus RN42 TaxID=1160509 RepID=A0A3N4IL63_ASCIM|nr:Yip1-domain-containing protein [Ascobolus immersus RN42]